MIGLLVLALHDALAAEGQRAHGVDGLAQLLFKDRGAESDANSSTRTPQAFAAVKCPSSWTKISAMKTKIA